MRKLIKLFDRLEDYTRAHLARHPYWYALFGGIAVVLFWRGVWGTADILAGRYNTDQHTIIDSNFLKWFFYEPNQIIFSIIALLLMGLMVSVFVGDRIIISGLRKEKTIEERTEEIVSEEVITLKHIRDEIRELKKEMEEMKK